MKVKPWTSEEDEIVKSWIQAGRPRREIAHRLGRSRDSVIGRSYRLGLSQTGAQGGGRASSWSRADDVAIRKLIREGLTGKQIAPLLDRPYSSVTWRIRYLGLAKPLEAKP